MQGLTPPKEPYFTKFSSCLIADSKPILIPKVPKNVDWEVELPILIDKKGRYLGCQDAMERVAGYTVVNDISFRDLQFPDG